MLLIYGTGRVGQAVARLCEYQQIHYEIHDDSSAPEDLDPYEIIIPSPGIAPTHRIYATGRVVCELDWASQWLPDGATTIAITGTDGKSTTSWIMYQILLRERENQVSTSEVFLSGNFEIPFSDTIREILERGIKRPKIVIEISSFMAYGIGLNPSLGGRLKGVQSQPEQSEVVQSGVREGFLSSPLGGGVRGGFTPDYTIFTNFAPDHLNWHPDLQNYLDSKWKLVSRAKQGAFLNTQILSQVEKLGLQIPSKIDEKVTLFSFSPPISGEMPLPQRKGAKGEATTDGELIRVSPRTSYHLSETHFSGAHNALNILACTLVAKSLSICSRRITQYLREITGLPHRIEKIAERGGITFIEDSKSTSCQSLRAALTAFDHSRLILIAGGSDKGDTFEGLEEDLRGVSHIVLIGATREILAQKCRQAGVEYSFAQSMQEAVEIGVEKALLLQPPLGRGARGISGKDTNTVTKPKGPSSSPGSTQAPENSHRGEITLLLSPGCASFGMFTDYLDRARQFREAVRGVEISLDKERNMI